MCDHILTGFSRDYNHIDEKYVKFDTVYKTLKDAMAHVLRTVDDSTNGGKKYVEDIFRDVLNTWFH